MSEFTIRRKPVGMTTRWPCSVCGGETAKTDRPYTLALDDHEVYVCDGCAEHPDLIPDEVRDLARRARDHADRLDELAENTFTVDNDDYIWLDPDDARAVAEFIDTLEYQANGDPF